MITPMCLVRVMGPRDLLLDVLRAIQDLGVLHLAAPPLDERLAASTLDLREERERRQLRRVLDDLAAVLPEAPAGRAAAGRAPPERTQVARWARLAGRVRRRRETLAAQRAGLEEERTLILKYQHLFSAFGTLLETASRWPNAAAYHVLLKSGEAGGVPALRASLAAAIGDRFALYTQRIPTGETALLVLVAAPEAPRVEHLLAEARVREIPVPEGYGATLGEALPGMLDRLAALPAALADVDRARNALLEQHGQELREARDAISDRLAELEAIPRAGVSAHAFVVDGWLPARARASFVQELIRRFAGRVSVTEVAREAWEADDAPVVLRNPRLFRPFEVVIRLLPLPHYGTMDPTPFVAVFFPAFFGLMLGDVGYGVVLALGALALRAVARPESTLRAVAEIAGACAVCTILAGFLFGELFGDLGRRWLGLHPLAFEREEALVPFLLLAVALGAVHVLLGLVLGALAERHHPRKAIGRGVSALMTLLILLALLAVIGVLPRPFFTPFAVGILVAFPILLVTEGMVGALELLATLGNILSYARIMALGVASVMLAVVANRMAGAVGSVAVGVMFALLFHLVNFAIGVFSPTIHALRLHYVEFFGKFYSPGGVRYEPFRHWTDAGNQHA